MSAEGGHLGWRSGSLDTILKIDHLRTIHAFSDSDLGSKWPPSADIVLTWDPMGKLFKSLLF
jgi:hypothetical protein